MKILITGAAGFIGHALAEALLTEGHEVVGIDNLNDYYSVGLKLARLETLAKKQNFIFIKQDLADEKKLQKTFSEHSFSHVVNLAAQAGVRYSLINPQSYIQSNIVGFANLLECCRHHAIKHLVYASSSSVYGMNKTLPFSTEDNVDHPVSLYAATKKSNELMAHSYSHLYALPTTGLRFFTVYGPWGRPDMALYIFTKAIFEDKPIPVFNNGKMLRDFTYIDDIVNGILPIIPSPAKGLLDTPKEPDLVSRSSAPYAIYNIGNNNAIPLIDFIHSLEEVLGKKAILDFLPMQNGDVPATYADIDPLRTTFHFTPKTSLHRGLKNWVAWYKSFHS